VDVDLPRGPQQRLDQHVPDALAGQGGVDGDRADLGQVLPEHVQRAAADHLAVPLDDPELLDILVQGDQVLGQQHPPGVLVHQRLDPQHITGAGAARDHGCHVWSA